MGTAVLDIWDISAIPTGATFDIQGNFPLAGLVNVDYPVGPNRVLEADLSGPFAFSNIFTRLTQSDRFQVLIISFGAGWSYEIQCVENAISTVTEKTYSKSLAHEVLREAFRLPPMKRKKEEVSI